MGGSPLFLDVVSALLSFLFAFAFVPAMRRVAIKTGFVDLPTERKAHKGPLPMLGGAAMLFAFMLSTILVRHDFLHATWRTDKPFIGMAGGALLMFIVGMVDDYAKTRRKEFPAWPKFAAQIIAASFLVASGVVIRGIEDPVHGAYFITFSPWLRDFLTIVWVVGIVNVFNFLDGMDGLAGGIAAISATTLMIISTIKGDSTSAILAASLIGVTLAFLRYNFYPARIIMGDAGSTFLGYVLAAIAVMGAFKSATVVSIFVPILALGVPIFDALYVVLRRVRERRPVHKADRTHGHYRLMASGLTQIQTVSVMYLVALAFCLASILIAITTR
ncbi:UDP-phosphate N-acetylgalactosaminyl-1-phosphate transferase [Ferroacidibacillus organovorans]|uniref:UDP-phosphate N-acetylgalactosaminyl-1-phosphate transferase n=2 Tax=Ferroacidibacillus organovorans TaxID=1765683 RepID=A0A853K822_9BACL|nr:undecaprenyl-phosphate alpha-N-acetylglucosaminyl 1-phosphate transferase [Ferroacidibacillus organovorans]OAG93083.1 UDP-phosphate N-acetylgalactosaminyl-1-phosphate transferase [Ferroacidibacillus organovorans]